MRYPMSEILPTVFECLTASELKQRLKLPLIAAPMFKVSSPELVTAVCRAGAIGAFPSINARTPALFDAWMARLGEALSEALPDRSEEHTSELQSLMRISYAVFCLKKKKKLVQTSYVQLDKLKVHKTRETLLKSHTISEE